MAKDPAFLFYPGDWQGGTVTMSRFLKGCYIDLLIAQFNSGPLSLEEIKTVLGSDFGTSWPSLQKKFKQADGLFFNERLEVEKSKRAEYTESRRNNRKKKTYDQSYDETYDNSCVKHMSSHMENENRNRNKDDNGIKEEEVQEKKPLKGKPQTDIKDRIEEILSKSLDELYIDQERTKWAHLNFEFELESFKNKVRGSPDEYRLRDSNGIRLAFQYQLRTSKGKVLNGKQQTNKGTDHINSLMEGYKRRNGITS